MSEPSEYPVDVDRIRYSLSIFDVFIIRIVALFLIAAAIVKGAVIRFMAEGS